MVKHLPSQAKTVIHHTEKIIRIMTFAKFRDESKPLFLALGILNTYELNLFLIALFMYSYFNNNLPEYFLNYFRLNEVMILDQHQIFLLNTEGRTTENFH